MSIIISSTVKSFPKHPYETIASDILGKKYELSLNFLGEIRAQKLNQSSRGKSYTPNVLSFPLDDTHGEIYITPAVAKKEASDYFLSYRGYVGFLFIHGLLHLKGYDHGPKMEALEKKYCDKYRIK